MWVDLRGSVCCWMYTAIASGSFERACVLFNIAAMQSQIAEAQNIGSDDGRKTAAKLFQVFNTVVLIEQIILSLSRVINTCYIWYCMYVIRASVLLWQCHVCGFWKSMFTDLWKYTGYSKTELSWENCGIL